MGTILTSRMADDKKVVIELMLEYDEYIQLKGHLHNVHVFSEDNVQTKANISQRGRNASTKYFLIPKSMRKNLKFTEETTCHKIELPTRKIFIYVVNKGGI
ncbi:MAG: hypothetical protein KKF52_03565 [Nanoarchaeota archaeon]|nr:hypothetical protein [Nanoarchaeota archaeon]MBU4351961.1 hypothetical protein [Nanoarchaeota archaeon]